MVMYIMKKCVYIDVVIGFERDEVAVYESAGRVKICVRIIKPSYTSKLESVYYYLRLSVISNSSKLYS